MACVLMVSGQIFNRVGYVCYVGSVSRIHKLPSTQVANLKFVPEFTLDPGGQLWLRSTTGQEEVVLEVNGLREYRRPLTNLLRIHRWLATPRDEPQARRIDDAAGFVKILKGEVDPPEDKAARRDGQHGLGLEFIVVPSLHFGQFFPHKLGIFLFEIEGTRGL